jgi:signal transduction histidine kinase
MFDVMKMRIPLLKKMFIAGLIIVITALHLGTSVHNMALHVIHRELYFLPILLSAFWFGLNAGFLVSLLVGFLYAFYIIAFGGGHVGMATVIPQVFVFILVGTVLGWLADRERSLQEKRLADNNAIVLGRAAAAVAHEMKNILNAMKSMFVRSGGFHAGEFDQDFQSELARLDKMVLILSSYAKEEEGRTFSYDVNRIIRDCINQSEKAAIEKGVIFAADLDPEGCPCWVDPNEVKWVIENLINNALEVSASGKAIILTSKRGGEFCTVTVKDEGPGISPEHLDKIFTPFFTTKPNGQGLTLAGCRKSLQDMGGDISVQSVPGEGAEFILQIPREHKGKPLAEDTARSVYRGHAQSRLTRE